MKHWLVASYKINEIKRLELNLLNQQFDYYLPKLITKKINSKPKEEVLFPGYIFINTSLEKYSAIKYTLGIKKIIKFGNHISYIADDEIESIKTIEIASQRDPIISKLKIGQDAVIATGSLKGSLVRICSLPSKKRVGVLLSILGSVRRINIPEDYLKI